MADLTTDEQLEEIAIEIVADAQPISTIDLLRAISTDTAEAKRAAVGAIGRGRITMDAHGRWVLRTDAPGGSDV